MTRPVERSDETRPYDALIVGAGSSGCALASRLAASGDRRVLLLEAGPDYGDISAHPAALQRSYNLSSSLPGDPHGWSYIGRLTAEVSYPVTRGKVLGGSSAVNGGQFTRGTPADYDSWASAGNTEWSFEKVLPYFIRLENDLDFGDGTWHGGSGPVPVRRPPDSELIPIAQAFVESALEAGQPWDPDLNDPTSTGVGTLPHNVVDGIRHNIAVAYLGLGSRPENLTIVDRAMAIAVLFEGRSARGVRAVRDGRTLEFRAGEVILSAGGLNSPHLLLLSGIGPADQLRRFAIPVIEDIPGVGQNLMDHPAVNVTYRTHRYVPPSSEQPAAQVCLNYSSGLEPYGDDMRMFPYSTSKAGMLIGKRDGLSSRLHLLRHPLAAIRAVRGISHGALLDDVRHRSDLGVYCGIEVEASRGALSLLSTDPTVMPAIDYCYLSEEADRKRLREGIRQTLGLLNHSAFRKLEVEITGPAESDLRSDRALDAWVAAHVRTAYHTSGTCRMGPDTAPATVVDQYCRVLGVEHLRVVDTSIMPSLTRRGTNASAVMIGERAAAFFS